MDDLISREEAIEWVQNILATHLYYHHRSKSRNVPIDEVIDRLERVPSIDAVPVKRGRWVPGREIGKEMLIDGSTEVVYEDYKCSSCGLILFRLLHNVDGTPFYKFCPNCGADMRGEEE